MLTLHPSVTTTSAVETLPADLPADTVWLDLLNGTDAEKAYIERSTGLRVPTRDDLQEIESSSRLVAEGDMLTLSMPIITGGKPGAVSPLGLILSPRYLLTVRFSPIVALDGFAAQCAGGGKVACSFEAFIGLLEAIVDQVADALEAIRTQLDRISHAAFEADRPKHIGLARIDARLRDALRAIGRAGEHGSNVRDTLLGVERIVPFATERARTWMPPGYEPRLGTLQRDIASLNDYEAQLSNKVQFLLDATLGFINMQQNDTIKLLTVVSVVGIPPTLVASIYGMNFKFMPELDWTLGYPFGLVLILLSGILPLLLFRLRGWL